MRSIATSGRSRCQQRSGPVAHPILNVFCAQVHDDLLVEDALQAVVGQKGISPELDHDSFATFYLAMGMEALERAGYGDTNVYVQMLPPWAARRFQEIRRCTFSWMTDRTSLALAKRLATLPTTGPEALRAIILAQCAFTSQGVFEALAEPSRGQTAVQIASSLREFFNREAEQAKRAKPRKSSISKSLQTGSLTYLGRGKGLIIDKVAAFVENLDQSLDTVWAAVAATPGKAAAVLARPRDAGGLGLLPFRAHCVARFLWLHSGGLVGTSPESGFLGSGALEALCRLEPMADAVAEGDKERPRKLEAAFAVALPRWRELVARKDTGGVVARLRALGLWPDAAQTYEHLLCEARKVFGQDRRDSRGPPGLGYKELFEDVVGFYQKASLTVAAARPLTLPDSVPASTFFGCIAGFSEPEPCVHSGAPAVRRRRDHGSSSNRGKFAFGAGGRAGWAAALGGVSSMQDMLRQRQLRGLERQLPGLQRQGS